MRAPAVILSLHDVSPLTQTACGEILADLEEAGAGGVLSLLVIPDHHAKAPWTDHPSSAAWLRGLVQSGAEPVLHGCFHRRDAPPGETGWRRLITSCYTDGEGEFFDIPKARAVELLDRGMSMLDGCGVTPRGFIAPAWLLGPAAGEAVREAGFLYTTRIGRIERLAPPARIQRAQSLVWSVRAAWRRTLSLWWNALLAARLAGRPVLRIGIHPPDWEFPAIRSQILAIARQALARRKAFTYDGWVTARMP